jgi:hypothetical protein
MKTVPIDPPLKGWPFMIFEGSFLQENNVRTTILLQVIK